MESDYILGLNYIENSNNAKSLRNFYINRLKEIREELINNFVQEKEKSNEKK